MKRPLSLLENLIDANIAVAVELQGAAFAPEQLRQALARVQAKHPALRMVLREQAGASYYDEDPALPEPLRIGPREAGEAEREVAQPFLNDQLQWRAVWLGSEQGSELIVVAAHRICDGASLFIIIREMLAALHTDAALDAYAPITAQDMAGAEPAASRAGQKLAGGILRVLSMVLPRSATLQNREFHLAWQAGPLVSGALPQRCRDEKVSLHAALLAALGEAMTRVLGKHAPSSIESPIDLRGTRRFPALKRDRLYFGGGGYQVAVQRDGGGDFWARARELDREIRRKMKEELIQLPRKYRFCEGLPALSPGKFRSLARFVHLLGRRVDGRRMFLSTLGEVAVCRDDAPFEATRVDLYAHSCSFKMLGIDAYVFRGELNFALFGDEQRLRRDQAAALRDAYMEVLERNLEAQHPHSHPSDRREPGERHSASPTPRLEMVDACISSSEESS